ncbi:MAG: hypothetical protein KAJ19_22565, partial [Gammaproteobacteria bacterium]|nr:hypothetical protein [Gammaproteobacteria bacterium]
MKNCVFDIEANGLNEFTIKKGGGLVPEATKIHCLVMRDFNTDEVHVFGPGQVAIDEGYKMLMECDLIIGHNCIMYDLPVLKRLCSKTWKYGTPQVFDTLVAARTIWPDRQHHPHGGNSLAALGKVCGCPKDDYDGGFDEFNEEMLKYCIQDTATGKAIFKWLRPKIKPFPVPIKIEHRVATIIAEQQDNGVCINVPRCEDLIDLMQVEKAGAYDQLAQIFQARIETMKTPAYYYVIDNNGLKMPDTRFSTIRQGIDNGWKRKHLHPGPLRTKEHEFNPGSSQQVADRLKKKYGWEAPQTKAGTDSVTEVILKGLDFPEADLIMHYNMAEKRLQHLSDWVTRARNCRTPGIIHPAINTIGCNTSRMSHSQPNQTAPPKCVHGPDGEVLTGYAGRYGVEMRACWGPKPGMVQVGTDASGLELRMLGNRLARFDGGSYARVVVEGDVHTLNMKAGGLQTRDQAKTT